MLGVHLGFYRSNDRISRPFGSSRDQDYKCAGEQKARPNSKPTYDRGAPPLPSAKVCLLSLHEKVQEGTRTRKHGDRRREARRGGSGGAGVRVACGHGIREKQLGQEVLSSFLSQKTGIYRGANQQQLGRITYRRNRAQAVHTKSPCRWSSRSTTQTGHEITGNWLFVAHRDSAQGVVGLPTVVDS